MDRGSESLLKMAEILDKIKALLKEYKAFMIESSIHSKNSNECEYQADITIHLS